MNKLKIRDILNSQELFLRDLVLQIEEKITEDKKLTIELDFSGIKFISEVQFSLQWGGLLVRPNPVRDSLPAQHRTNNHQMN